MAEPVGAASLSSAHARQSAPTKRCDRGVGEGICAPSGATPSALSAHSYKPMDPNIAQQRAQSLIDNAIKESGGDRLNLFSQIDNIFKRERWAVREAIRKNPAFKGIVDGAADGLINGCLRDAKNSDLIVLCFYQFAMKSHPELAGSLCGFGCPYFREKWSGLHCDRRAASCVGNPY